MFLGVINFQAQKNLFARSKQVQILSKNYY